MISKFLIRRKIKKIIEELNVLGRSNGEASDFLRWKRAALSIAREVWTKDSDLYERIETIEIEDPMELDFDGEPQYYADPIEHMDSVQKYLGRAVEELLATLDQTGLPHGYRAPVQKIVISNVLSLVSGLIIACFGIWLVDGQTEENAVVPIVQDQAAILLVDLTNSLEVSDRRLRRTLDSITAEQASRSMFGAGEGVTQIIEFSKDYRIQRDNTIDSVLVRLRSLNVNTDTIKISRRLPVRIDQYLKSRLEMFDEPFVRNLRLDTL